MSNHTRQKNVKQTNLTAAATSFAVGCASAKATQLKAKR